MGTERKAGRRQGRERIGGSREQSTTAVSVRTIERERRVKPLREDSGGGRSNEIGNWRLRRTETERAQNESDNEREKGGVGCSPVTRQQFRALNNDFRDGTGCERAVELRALRTERTWRKSQSLLLTLRQPHQKVEQDRVCVTERNYANWELNSSSSNKNAADRM